MNASPKGIPVRERGVMLSTLWIFAMLNYVYADVYTLFFEPVLQPESWRQFLTGNAGGLQLTEGFVLVTAVLMETAIAMVLLSRVLDRGANRWVNIGSGAFHTAFVAWSLIGEAPSLFYLFFAIVEIACTLFIVWYAWTWHSPEAVPEATKRDASVASRAPTAT